MKCSLEKFSFQNFSVKRFSQPQIKIFLSKDSSYIEVKILIIYRDLLAHNWACRFLYWVFAGCSRESVLWLSLQHEPASAAVMDHASPSCVSGVGHLGGEVGCQSPPPCVSARPLCWAVPGRSHGEASQCKRNKQSCRKLLDIQNPLNFHVSS